MATVHPQASEPQARTAPVPAITAFAFSRLLNASERAEPLELTREGHLVVTVRGEIMARTDAMLLGSQNLVAQPLARRMQGRSIGEVFHRLVSIAGEGHMVLSCDAERFFPLQLRRDLCFFVERYLWAIEPTLMWDVGTVPLTRRSRPIPLVRVAGAGRVALRVPGELVAIKIAVDRPYRIRHDPFVGWVGNVVVQQQDADFLTCEGEGAVLVALPQPREVA